MIVLLPPKAAHCRVWIYSVVYPTFQDHAHIRLNKHPLSSVFASHGLLWNAVLAVKGDCEEAKVKRAYRKVSSNSGCNAG